MRIVIDEEHYGSQPMEFSSVNEAQESIRTCGGDFAGVVLKQRGDGIYDEEKRRVGYVRYPLASIEADMEGSPRIPIYHDRKRLYAIMPDGERQDICDGECTAENAWNTIMTMYGGCAEWALEWC